MHLGNYTLQYIVFPRASIGVLPLAPAAPGPNLLGVGPFLLIVTPTLFAIASLENPSIKLVPNHRLYQGRMQKGLDHKEGQEEGAAPVCDGAQEKLWL
eukprot:COSAG05_NODE_579_length_8556_cov_44.773679_3_plen_98_part_00